LQSAHSGLRRAGFSYLFSGLRLDADTALAGFRTGCHQADFGFPVLKIAHAGANPLPEHRLLYQWLGRFGTSISQCTGGFLVKSAACGALQIDQVRHRLIWFDTNIDPVVAGDFLIRRALPRASLLYANMAYHAAAVGDGRKAILLLGDSGSGKTSMATAIASQSGWSLLSEDYSIFEQGSPPHLLPGATGSGHWAEGCAGLGLPAERCRPLAHYDQKYWYEPVQPESGRESSAKPQELAAIMLLSRGSQRMAFRAVRVPNRQALAAIARHFIPFYPGDGGDTVRLRHAASLVETAPTWLVDFPTGYDRIHEVASQLLALLPS
jgi:hypothetical protein